MSWLASNQEPCAEQNGSTRRNSTTGSIPTSERRDLLGSPATSKSMTQQFSLSKSSRLAMATLFTPSGRPTTVLMRGRSSSGRNGKTHPAEPEDIENLEQRLQGARLSVDLAFVGDLPISWFDKPALIATITEVADQAKGNTVAPSTRTRPCG